MKSSSPSSAGGTGANLVDAPELTYGLQRLSDFPGTYFQTRYGFAPATKSAGSLWLKNGKNLTMHLVAERTGLMLTLGGDAVVIRMKE
jgi:hypothetical protein